MSRINTNVTALVSARIHGRNNKALNNTLEKLSTGFRINRGEDDPAGLIASENLRADLAATRSAMANAQRAQSIVSTAEGALSEISGMLVRLQELVGLAGNTGGMTDDEIAANQVQVDGIVSSIQRISSETSFQGIRLLNGSMDFQFTNSATAVQDLVINNARLGSLTALSANVEINTAATIASNTAVTGALGSNQTVEISGRDGAQVFTFANGTSVDNMVTAILAAKEITGVSAANDTGSLKLYSTEYGADEFVKVRVLSGGTGQADEFSTGSDDGTDAVVMVNGQQAAVDGYDVSLRLNNLNIDFQLKKGAADDGSDDGYITITGGGTKFSLSPNVGAAGTETIGIQSVAPQNLGDSRYGFLNDITAGQSEDLATDPTTAQRIVGAAIQKIATMRGRLGSFLKDTVNSALNSLQITYENVSAAESQIRDTDFATETAALTRNQILVNASTSVLAMANTAPQSVLSLLG